jgi:hypothetical protein
MHAEGGDRGELTLFTLSRVITYLPSHYLNHHECILSDYYSISAVAVEAAEIACSRRLKQKKWKGLFYCCCYYGGGVRAESIIVMRSLPVTHTHNISTCMDV